MGRARKKPVVSAALAAPADGVVELGILLEISQLLLKSSNSKRFLHRVLEILGRRDEFLRSAATLLRPDRQELYIEAASGLTASGRRARYHLGEGITGRVVESGKPIVVPKVSREPLFLKRADRREELRKRELSFVCVPILINNEAVGALGVDLPFRKNRDYERVRHFLNVVSSMIAQAIRVGRLIEAERARLSQEHSHLLEELKGRYDFANIIGTSGGMKQVYEQVAQVAHSSTTVLIRGESGTGKDLIAHAIHYNSLRAQQPFIKVSCAALPDTLIESELFGYEKGAFTGAQSRKEGRFEMAHGGTLFLDEIGELHPLTQAKLLRVLQTQEFELLGGTKTIKVDVRLIAATNKDLEPAMAEGIFRQDLYYRLNVFTIFVPPLRERKPDIPLLADYFLEKYSTRHGKNIRRISTPAIDMLMRYHWPGNVREVENAVERAVLVCDDQVIHGYHLPPTLQTAEASGTVMNISLEEAVAAYEKDLIQDALKTTRGNRARAAGLLNTTERVIGYKVKKYNISCERFRR